VYLYIKKKKVARTLTTYTHTRLVIKFCVAAGF
jgi:hypothetical protein